MGLYVSNKDAMNNTLHDTHRSIKNKN